jgi:FAD/FMN-containing dehydrogenase
MGLMSERIDRRGFLTGAGTAGAAFLTGCGPAAIASGSPAKRRKASPVPKKLQQAMRGHVFTRGAPGFSSVAHVYNERFDGVFPNYVARPINAADVRGAVRWAVAHNVPLRARSGGHSYAGYSTMSGGVVLDLRKLNWVHVNRGQGTASIGAGAQLIDVYSALAAQGATLPAGSCPSVGITGVTLGGGMGLAGRAFGLTADNLIAVDIVTADGRSRHVDKSTDRSFLWALRGGGGGNFGVVTQLHYRIHPLPSSAAYFNVTWPWSSAAHALQTWLQWAPHTHDQITSIFHLNSGQTVSANGQYLGPASDLGGLLSPLASVPGASIGSGNSGYLSLQKAWAGCSNLSFAACHTVGTYPGGTFPREKFWAKSDYIKNPLSSSGAQAFVSAIDRHQSQGVPGSAAILFDSYGGAINNVAPNATAFVHRDALCAIQYLSYNGGAAWLQQTWQSLRPYVSGQAYQNYIDAGLSNWRQAYYGSNYAKLVSVQKRVDPHHKFNFPQAIGR